MAHRYGGRSSPRPNADASTQSLARSGWFSIGLGVTELVAPGQLARFLGMERRTELIRLWRAGDP